MVSVFFFNLLWPLSLGIDGGLALLYLLPQRDPVPAGVGPEP